MKSGQNSLVALTALEEMAMQLSQQNFSMAPNQSLIQFLSTLPETRSWKENFLQRTSARQRLGSHGDLFPIREFVTSAQEGWRDVGRWACLLWPTLERDLAGNIIPRQATEVGERDERVVVEEGVENTMMERMVSKRWPSAGLVEVRLTEKKGASRSVSVAARRDINPPAALIRSAVCVVVKTIRLRSAPTLSLF